MPQSPPPPNEMQPYPLLSPPKKNAQMKCNHIPYSLPPPQKKNENAQILRPTHKFQYILYLFKINGDMHHLVTHI